VLNGNKEILLHFSKDKRPKNKRKQIKTAFVIIRDSIGYKQQSKVYFFEKKKTPFLKEEGGGLLGCKRASIGISTTKLYYTYCMRFRNY